jgi:hypothetical protein
MSLFIRMAQTRSGAERLLDSQLIPILAQCDYLDARPEADQTFLGELLPINVDWSLSNSYCRSRFVLTFCCATLSPALHARASSH